MVRKGENLNDLANMQNLKKAIWRIRNLFYVFFCQKGQNQNLVYRPVKLSNNIFLIFLTQVTVGENEGIESALNCWRKRRH